MSRSGQNLGNRYFVLLSMVLLVLVNFGPASRTAAQLPPGVTLGPEVPIPGGSNYSCDLCVNRATGDLHIVWNSAPGGVIYHSSNTGSGWSNPAELVPGPTSVGGIEEGTRCVATEMDGQGRVHIVYIANSGTRLYHIHQEGTGWSTPVLIYQGTSDLSELQMAGTSQNALYVVFTIGFTAHRTYYNGSSWSSPASMGMTSHVYQIMVDSQDKAHCVFMGKATGEYEGYYATNKTGSWQTTQITNQGGSVDCPVGVVDGSGNLHVIWGKIISDHDATEKYSLYTGSPITGGEQIATTNAHSFARLVCDAGGVLYGFLPRRWPPKFMVKLAGEPWTDPIPYGQSGDGGDGYWFFDVVAHGSDVHMVYSNWRSVSLLKPVTYRKITRTSVIHFTDVTSAAGVPGISQRGAHGALWCDVNNDGLEDIYVTNIDGQPNNPHDILYMNRGDGTFVDESTIRGIDNYYQPGTHGAVFCDLDNDGDFDAFVCTTALDPPYPPEGTYDHIYRNEGNGYFTDITNGIPQDVHTSTRGVVAADIDGDGDVDLYGTNQLADTGYPNPKNPPVYLESFFINDGSAQFTPADRGVLYTSFSQGATFADIDEDGDIDLAETHWFTPSTYYTNDGNGNFTDVGTTRGMPTDSRKDNGITLGDIDNDGDLDMATASDHGVDVYRNNGSGFFTHIANFTSDGGFMVSFGDFDHDGDLDLYHSGGSIYQNDGSGNLAVLSSSQTGLSYAANGFNDPRGCGLGDYDNDGDLDIYVADKRAACHLFRSDLDDPNFLKIKLIDCRGQMGALGTKIKVYDTGYVGDPAHLRGYRQVIGAYGYCGQDSPIIHFGLLPGIYDVHIRYLTGEEATLTGVTPGRYCEVDCASWWCSDPDSVSIDMGTVDFQQGLRRVAPGDGDTVPVDIGGRNARSNDNPSNDFYFYFDVSSSFAYQGSKNRLSITIDYYDTGSGSLTLQYDAADGMVYKTGGSVALTGTNTWKQHTYKITDAYFGNRQNAGADFRIFGGVGNAFYLDLVTVWVPPEIKLDIASIDRSVEICNNLPEDGFTVSNVGGGTLEFTVSEDATWLSVVPDNGTSTGEADPINIVYDTDELAVGDHLAVITIEDPYAINSPQEITVNLHVYVPGDFDLDGDVDLEDFGAFQACLSGAGFGYPAGCEDADLEPDGDVDQDDFTTFQSWMTGANRPPPCWTPPEDPEIQLNVSSLERSIIEGNNLTNDTFTVRNSGVDTLVYDISDDADWLEVSPNSGTSTGEADPINIIYSTAGLTVGDYNAVITIEDENAINSPQTISVLLHVNPEPIPEILLSISSLERTVTEGDNLPNDSFTVTNSGTGTLDYTISDDAAWLEVSPNSGTSIGESDPISIIYSTAGLSVGDYNATITVEDDNAGNSPQTITVNLEVIESGSGTITLYATNVGKTGSSAGWNNIANAQGNDDNTYAYNNIGGTEWNYHLIAEDWDAWDGSGKTITGVEMFVRARATVSVSCYLRAYYNDENLLRQSRTVNTTKEWKQITPPTPGGGWTKSYIDDLRLFFTCNEQQAQPETLEAYMFKMEISYATP